MEVKIISKKNNALFNRVELVAQVTGFDATPSRKEVSELLCSELKCEANRLVIREVHQPFGSKKVAVTASVYESVEKAKEFEREYIFARGTQKEAQAKS